MTIVYLHEKALGAPKPIRNGLRETGDYRSYFEPFNTYLKTQGGVLRRLADAFAGTAIALMCVEKDAARSAIGLL